MESDRSTHAQRYFSTTLRAPEAPRPGVGYEQRRQHASAYPSDPFLPPSARALLLRASISPEHQEYGITHKEVRRLHRDVLKGLDGLLDDGQPFAEAMSNIIAIENVMVKMRAWIWDCDYDGSFERLAQNPLCRELLLTILISVKDAETLSRSPAW